MYFLVVFCVILITVKSAVVTDVTSDLFTGDSSDILAAFGDFNADKLTDLFVISNDGSQVDVLLADEKNKKYQRQALAHKNESYFRGVVPGDYNGDLQMDFLATLANEDGTYGIEVYWSPFVQSETTDNNPTTLDSLKDAPLVLDWNADMIPDIMGETEDGLFVWVAGLGEKKFNKTQISNESDLTKPHSSAFLDLNDDFTPDIFLTRNTRYEEWFNLDGHFTFNNSIPLPSYRKDEHDEPYQYIGQATFVDFNQDSVMDLIVPVCKDIECKESEIVMYYSEKWMVISQAFIYDSMSWGFVTQDNNRALKLPDKQQIPTTIRMGDFNMDGYPDALAILQTSVEKQAAFLLINEECKEKDGFCHTFGRKLVVQWESQFSNIYGAILATFYDIYEDGILDILLVAVTSDQAKPVLRAFKNIFTADACFVKISVASGLCYKNCPDNRKPFAASNQPGPFVKYQTVSPVGKPQKSCAAQLSQSAHFALQLPYIVFGLGQTPNFVDKLSVGIPQNTAEKLHREWTQIIPNSQLLVIPYPHDEPSYWALHLFVTPSHLIYITGAVLLGTIGFVAGILGILHLRERREDKLEKQQESQKFHFDAM